MKKLIGYIVDFFTSYRPGTPIINWGYTKKYILYLLNPLNIKRKPFYSYFKIKLGDINSVYLRDIRLRNRKKRTDISTYRWDKLKESISTYGLLKPPIIQKYNSFDPIENKHYKYTIKDGNHRITVLKELYSPNYKIKVKIHV